MAILEDTHWRDAARTPRFYFMDAYSAIPLLFLFLHISLTTFLVCVMVMVFFIALEKFKFTLPVFFRWLKASIAGPMRTARPWWRQ